MNLLFFANSILLGVGLAMDAFSVSVGNGLAYPDMKKRMRLITAGTYAGFQFLMPVIGWFCVSTIAEYSKRFQRMTPWISLLLLLYIGGKMIFEAVKGETSGENLPEKDRTAGGRGPALQALFLEGIATSIDALSVGFTAAGYRPVEAVCMAFIIAAVTFVICLAGIRIGRLFGDIVGTKAGLLGGMILVVIGIEIFLRGF